MDAKVLVGGDAFVILHGSKLYVVNVEDMTVAAVTIDKPLASELASLLARWGEESEQGV